MTPDASKDEREKRKWAIEMFDWSSKKWVRHEREYDDKAEAERVAEGFQRSGYRGRVVPASSAAP